MSDLEDYIKSLVDAGEKVRKQFALLNTDLLQSIFTAQKNFEEALAFLIERSLDEARGHQFLTIGRTKPKIIHGFGSDLYNRY